MVAIYFWGSLLFTACVFVAAQHHVPWRPRSSIILPVASFIVSQRETLWRQPLAYSVGDLKCASHGLVRVPDDFHNLPSLLAWWPQGDQGYSRIWPTHRCRLHDWIGLSPLLKYALRCMMCCILCRATIWPNWRPNAFSAQQVPSSNRPFAGVGVSS